MSSPRARRRRCAARGLDAFRDRRGADRPISPSVDVGAIDELGRRQIADRVARPARCMVRGPGLLAIGDAAHAMSPIGGVGINLAIQDAVAAANILAGAAGGRARMSIRCCAGAGAAPAAGASAIQGLQNAVQDRILDAAASCARRCSTWCRCRCGCSSSSRSLRRIPGAVLGFGLRREHVRSPEA